MTRPIPDNWFVRAFGSGYRELYSHRDTSQAEAEAAFALSALGLGHGDRLLDLGCGWGRHLARIEGTGVTSVGLDLSPQLLCDAAGQCPGSALVRSDMRALPFFEAFDGVTGFFTVFGYFDDPGNLRVLRQIRSALKPGGRFLLDLPNAEFLKAHLVPEEARKIGDRHATIHRRLEKSRVIKEVAFDDGDHVVESVRVYGAEELSPMIRASGLHVSDIFGGFETGARPSPDTPRLVVTGRRGPFRVRRTAYDRIAPLRDRTTFIKGASRFDDVAPHFAHRPDRLSGFRERLDAIDHRRGLSESLGLTLLEHNRRRGAGHATQTNLERLAHGRAFAVVTGQQPGLLGGPSYVLYKIATTVALCRALEARGLGEFVPVFWSAGDDHDTSEFTVWRGLGTKGLNKITLDLPDPARGRPASGIEKAGMMAPVLEAMRSDLPDNDFRPLLEKLLSDLPQDGPVPCFETLLQKAFAGWGLILVDPRFLRPEGMHLFERELIDPDTPSRLLKAQGERLAAAGLEAPLSGIDPTNLFFEDDAGYRRKVAWDGERFTVKGMGEVEPFDLLGRFQRLSPNVALRPILQDMVLPVAATVAGPSEYAYFAQLLPLYEHMGLDGPLIFPRLSATVLDHRTDLALTAAGHGPEALLAGRAPDLGSGPMPLPTEAMEAFEALGRDVTQRLHAVRASLPALPDRTRRQLDGFADFVGSKARKLQSDVAKAIDSGAARERKALARARDTLLPDGRLQERWIGWLTWLARYGPFFPESVVACCDPFDFRHHLLIV